MNSFSVAHTPIPPSNFLPMAFRRQVKNFMKNYSDAEIKVREATSNDPWGPSSSLMLDISDLTFNTISLSEIMNILWQRLGDHGKSWRHVYKSLTFMDYLIKNGSKKVIQHCREGFRKLQTLKDFQHVDEAGKDQGKRNVYGVPLKIRRLGRDRFEAGAGGKLCSNVSAPFLWDSYSFQKTLC